MSIYGQRNRNALLEMGKIFASSDPSSVRQLEITVQTEERRSLIGTLRSGPTGWGWRENGRRNHHPTVNLARLFSTIDERASQITSACLKSDDTARYVDGALVEPLARLTADIWLGRLAAGRSFYRIIDKKEVITTLVPCSNTGAYLARNSHSSTWHSAIGPGRAAIHALCDLAARTSSHHRRLSIEIAISNLGEIDESFPDIVCPIDLPAVTTTRSNGALTDLSNSNPLQEITCLLPDSVIATATLSVRQSSKRMVRFYADTDGLSIVKRGKLLPLADADDAMRLL